jgi:hypothetical protein
MCSHFGGLVLTNSAVIGAQGTALLPSDNYWDCQGPTFPNETWVVNSNPTLSPLYVHMPTLGYQPIQNGSNNGLIYTQFTPVSIYTTTTHNPYAMDCFANYAYPPFPSWRASSQNSLTTNVDESEFDDATVRVYPNPTNGLLTIACENKDEIMSISIYDLNGQILIQNISFHQSQNQLDVSGLPASLYIIEVKNAESKIVRKKLMKSE